VSPDVEVSATYVPIDSNTRLAADHYPVVSDIELPGSAVGIRRKEPTLPPADGEQTDEIAPEDEPGTPPPM
jgi:hypothetical protein